MTRTFIFIISIALALMGCSASTDTAVAEAGVPKFHKLLDAGNFAEIYEQSSDNLKKVSKQNDFVVLLDAVHRKLGITKSSEKQGWNISYHTSGTFVTLTYKTVYSEGEAAEQFVFVMQGKAAMLAGYHINSNALILK
jgi:hypothetical protein